MNDKPRFLKISDESPWFQLFVTVVIILGIGSVLMLLLTLAGAAIFGADMSALKGSATILNVKDISFLRYLLIVQDISILIIPSLIILKLSDWQRGIKSAGLWLPSLKDAGIVVLMTFCLFPVTSFTGELNSAMHLPSWLSGIEDWMIDKEKITDNLIDSLINSRNAGTVILNLITIALIPAIAEELLFRGVLQKIFGRLFRSAHAGIWFTAFLFSTVHFQFFGFVPRFILGLAFGYLYFWGRTLWLPVIAHFVNNAFPLIITYFEGNGSVNDHADMALWKQALAVPIPLVVIFLILVYFRNKKKENPVSGSIISGQ
jgi:hypothetical protein